MCNVEAAFDLLLEAIEIYRKELNKQICTEADRSAYDYSQALVSKAKRVEEYQKQIEQMQRDFLGFLAHPSTSKTSQRGNPTLLRGVTASKKRVVKHPRLSTGKQTPTGDFIPYILEALRQLGGRAKAQMVIDKVGELMQSHFNNYDLAFVNEANNRPRWRNSVGTARQKMVERHQLIDGGTSQVWELSDRANLSAS